MKNYVVESMTSYMGKLEEARNSENDDIKRVKEEIDYYSQKLKSAEDKLSDTRNSIKTKHDARNKNESLSLKEDVNAKWTEALLLKFLRKEIQETVENFPWNEGSRFKITNLKSYADRLTLFASCENPNVSEEDAVEALTDCIINAFANCGIESSRDSVTVVDLREVGLTSQGDFCITLQF